MTSGHGRVDTVARRDPRGGPTTGANTIIVAGQIQVDAADREQYVADCYTVVRESRAAAGCLDFAITADPLEPDRINIFERWESDAELEAFRGSGPSADQTAQIIAADVRRYRISRGRGRVIR